jgi:hypothetical protein
LFVAPLASKRTFPLDYASHHLLICIARAKLD